jgi:Zn-dependent M28 family amino/carboxypeptidase
MLSLSFLLPIGCDTDPPYRGIRTHTVDPAGPENEEPESDPPEKEEEAPADWTDEGTIPVEIDALFDHLEALQTIADDNDGNRSAGSPGYDASLDYAASQLEEVGYVVSLHEFTINYEEEVRPPELELLSSGEVFEEGEDFTTITYTGSGEVVGPLVAVDLQLPPGPEPNDSSSGCEAGDFFGFPTGGIALIQRGSCSFRDKTDLAIVAGASAVLIFNEGQEGRQDLYGASLGGRSGEGADVPVLALSFEVGEHLADLAESGDTNIRVMADVELFEMLTANLIAETPGASEDVVVVGGHLDSVKRGPGINDNGSGAMLVLELALTMAREEITLNNPIRWVLWGGEELGLLGSFAYVRGLDDEAHAQILANLNFDMVASPNPARFVYDGDGSSAGEAGPTGSGQIEAMFEYWFEEQGLAILPTAFDGRSDYGPFIWSGIPAGGLFTGAEQQKTSDEVDDFGEELGAAYDACYHQACDTIDNIDPGMYAEMAAGAGHAVLSLGNLEGGFALAGPPGERARRPMPTGLGGCHNHTNPVVER